MEQTLMSHHYEILGLPLTSTKSEIKKRFHELAHKYHPDKNNGDDFMFKRISNSYKAMMSSTWIDLKKDMQHQEKNSATTLNDDLNRVYCNDAGDFFWTEDIAGIVVKWWGKWPALEPNDVVQSKQ